MSCKHERTTLVAVPEDGDSEYQEYVYARMCNDCGQWFDPKWNKLTRNPILNYDPPEVKRCPRCGEVL